MIDNNSIEQLKQTIDIVDVVGNYVELKKNGSNFKGLCPFHNEKTPSFIVSPAKQYYKCFGCGAGGDAIKFVMEYEKLSYPEAIEKLANLYNFTLRYTEGKQGGGQEKRILETIGQWYRANLEHNNSAKEYLQSRGVSLASIEKFSLGFAPSSEETIRFLQRAMIPMQKAEEVGILGSDNGRYYARLIDRIIFPIYSSSGMPVGFGGRTMGNHPAKYINSPQTKLFNKSRLLYGYNLAKEQIYRKKRLIVVEGYMDVIMLHQAGFNTAVATLGTALTNDHLPLLKKGEPEIIVAYDGDNAGINAAMKAALLLSSHNFEGGIVLFGNGMDPADMVNAGNANTIEALFSKPIAFAQFVIDRIVASHNIHTPKGKEDAFFAIKNYLSTLSPFVEENYRRYAASLLGVNVARLAPKDEKQIYKKYQYNKNNIETKQQPIKQSFLTLTDVAEESIIKTLLKIPSLTDMVLDTMDSSMFKIHREAFEALIRGEEHEDLLRIDLDDTIVIYQEDELKKQLVYFLRRYYQKALDNIKNNDTLPFEKKIFFIRKYQDYINKLKRGELVQYESHSTI
ncbi:DNA primase [Hydrogenimonas thermophila]|uniref:DNA primase n=1 Tax=Hydrogenimonas thermophila TaxID=223786 RepID=A0A1I5UBU9_9BACT|nr:DNA primase [Hydrogenimonas thermophila]SFP92668.1 DNA primase [Hydrogenimonas thermophila]